MEDSGSVEAIARFMTRETRHRPRHAGGGAGRRDRHLWRRQPVRRLLRSRADGAGAVPRRRHPAPADAGGDRARHLDLHHVGAAGHACHPKRHPDAVLRHHALRRARASASSPPPSCWASDCGGSDARRPRRGAPGEGYGGDSHVPVDAAADDLLCASEPRWRSEFDPAEIPHGQHSDTRRPIVLAALPLVVVVAGQPPDVASSSCRGSTRVPRRGALGRDLAFRGRRRVVGGGGAGRGHRDADRAQLPAPALAARKAWMPAPTPSVLPALSVASLVGFGAVVAALPAFALVRDWVLSSKAGRWSRSPSPPTSSRR